MKLWYANTDYNLRLDHLVSVWTTHVSNADSSAFTVQTAALVTSIFPERDRSCHLVIHEQSDEGVLCKTPLGYKEGHALRTLMTVKNFAEGGSDVKDGMILVCVKSIGARKKCTSSPFHLAVSNPDTNNMNTAEKDGFSHHEERKACRESGCEGFRRHLRSYPYTLGLCR